MDFSLAGDDPNSNDDAFLEFQTKHSLKRMEKLEGIYSDTEEGHVPTCHDSVRAERLDLPEICSHYKVLSRYASIVALVSKLDQGERAYVAYELVGSYVGEEHLLGLKEASPSEWKSQLQNQGKNSKKPFRYELCNEILRLINRRVSDLTPRECFCVSCRVACLLLRARVVRYCQKHPASRMNPDWTW